MVVIPKKSTYLNNFFSLFQDRSGQSQGVVEIPGIIHASGLEVLGRHFNFGIYPSIYAFGYQDNDLQVSRVGLTDTYLVPAALTWNFESLHLIVFEGILAPTGYCRPDAPSTGLNIWTFDHNAAATWYLPGNNELSVNLGYMHNLKNPETDYHSGEIIHLDYLVGHYFNDSLGLGIAGSYFARCGTG